MNISQPIPSAIESVDFAFLSREEIRSLSVKQIQNPTTFDTLLHPVPGGLYDPALGAWGENACATCNLNSSACPGHCGHIELPIPVYHVTFVDQITRLLRGQCAHCWQFKMSRKDIDMYICKLRLIQYGLLDALDLLESLEDDKKPSKEDQDDASDEDESNQPISLLLKKRRDLVEKSIQASRNSRWHWSREKNEGVAEARRSVIKDFMASMAKGKTCRNCQAISRKIRKDKYVKLFETPLEGKDKAKMEQGAFTFKNAVVVLSNDKKPDHEDEGIADIDLSDSSEGEGEQLDVNGDVVMENEPSTHRTKSKSKKPSAGEIYIPPKEAHARLTLLFETEQELLSLVYNSRAAQDKPVKITADMFFIETLLVPPNKFRPEAKTGAGEIAEAQQNSLYKAILNNSDRFAQIVRIVQGLEEDKSEMPRQRTIVDLHEAGIKIQESVNALIDKDRNPIQGGAGKNNEDGIKQKLEKKEGLFRKNMMGKRVNFAARSVISPDPNIETNEIGVPPVFAKKLTYPEPVTSHNYREMRQAVMNGPDKWPGAAAIENENGMVINLAKKTYDERVALSNQLLAPSNSTSNGSRNKKVHRHLTNGDVVLMNRQPTLHKPSIMGHRARVLPGEKTIRMHYANCNTYNADFDGDEMNMHFPQSEVARAEALQIADTDHQYLVATSGKPLRGLIQDHLSGGVWMTNRDTFFDREKYQQLLYNCLRPECGHTNSDRIETVPPAILKPRAMWTGKQVITTILTNITPPDCAPLSFTSNSTSKDQWGQGSEEGLVLFSKGQMISGILDKAQLGPTSGGLVHSVHEVYGPTVAGKLLSILGRLLTKFLHMRAFTCGMDDLVLTPKGDEERKRQLQESHNIGLEVATKYVTLEDQTPTDTDPELLRRLEDVLRDDSKQDGLDRLMNTKTANLSAAITKACLPRGLVKRFPKNQMQLMTTSGAKGSAVNANLISCNLGQQVLEGRRVPVMVSGKSLPCFKPFDTDIRAGGYVINRFLTGIRPQEYYFHAMAGREGLIDTAVKTSRSGYLQRCLIKGMEGLKVEYDTSVRDADGSLVQFISGEDGLDVTKQKHLTDFSFLIRNFDSEVAQLNMGKHLDVIQDESEQVKGLMKAAIKATKKGDFSSVDTVMTHYQPGRHLYATSESFHNLVADYLKKNPDGLVKSRKSKGGSSSYEDPDARPKALLEVILNTKYLRSVVEPGEVVGIVAGQSVGEPSTQMTLNTFHLAGHSTRNVTLGIPRLREIVMTASAKISTPSMTLFLIEELSAEEGEKVSRAISKLSLAEIVDEATVDERMDVGMTRSRAKIYEFTLKFFPMKEYAAIYAITKEDVIATLVQKFVPKLQSAARKALGKKKSERSGKVVSDALPVIGESAGAIEQADDRGNAEDGDDDEGEEEEDDDEGEDDATGAKQKANRGQAISYAANDENDDVVQAHAQDMEEGDEYENDDERPGGGQPSSSDEFGTGKKAKKYNAGAAADREGVVKDKNQDVGYFQFDDKDGAWCKLSLEYNPDVPKVLMLSILEKSLHNSLIQQIPGLGKCSFVPNDKVKDFATGKDVTAAVIHTDGVNLKAMQNYPQYINPNKTSTNDIAAMLWYYGVEACRANIIQELTAVFVGHGITVDNRHLNLIADYMTRSGGFKPFNRTGLTGSTSPFMKMSFETTLGFLRDAVLDGDWDNLTSPSSRIVLGRTSKAGTGAFDVFTKVPTAAVAAQ